MYNSPYAVTGSNTLTVAKGSEWAYLDVSLIVMMISFKNSTFNALLVTFKTFTLSAVNLTSMS